jgi:hypothetical protein
MDPPARIILLTLKKKTRCWIASLRFYILFIIRKKMVCYWFYIFVGWVVHLLLVKEFLSCFHVALFVTLRLSIGLWHDGIVWGFRVLIIFHGCEGTLCLNEAALWWYVFKNIVLKKLKFCCFLFLVINVGVRTCLHIHWLIPRTLKLTTI